MFNHAVPTLIATAGINDPVSSVLVSSVSIDRDAIALDFNHSAAGFSDLDLEGRELFTASCEDDVLGADIVRRIRTSIIVVRPKLPSNCRLWGACEHELEKFSGSAQAYLCSRVL